MEKNKKQPQKDIHQENEYAENVGIDAVDPEEGDETCAEASPELVAEVESQNEALEVRLAETEAALAKEKKEYLFLMAEFDNFRKRVTREKADIMRNGAEKAFKGLLPIVDDFERGLDAIKDSSDAEAVKQGMELIYNKLIKFLSDNGVKAMESTGAAFDSELHEAIATIPAPADDQKGKVIDTTSKGYMLNDKVLRHAKVVVGE